MEQSSILIVFITLAVGTAVYLAIPGKIRSLVYPVAKVPCLYDDATIALDRIASWTTWLTSLQTAAMASMALMIKESSDKMCSDTIFYGSRACIFFGASIVLAVSVLGGLPSIQQRLIKSTVPEIDNDVYEINIFGHIPIPLGRFSGLIHAYFLIGMVFFSMFIMSSFSAC